MSERILKIAAEVDLVFEDSDGFFFNKKANVKEIEMFAQKLLLDIVEFNEKSISEDDGEVIDEFIEGYTTGWNQKTSDLNDYIKNYLLK